MSNSNEKYIYVNTRTSHKRWESMVVYALHYALRDLQLSSQFSVNEYLIDLYIPAANLAIEIDEKHHAYNKNLDQVRQNIISESLRCKFFRINVNESVYDQVDEIVNYVRSLNLPKWECEKFSSSGSREYSSMKIQALESYGVREYLDALRGECEVRGIKTGDVITSDAGNGMLSFTVHYDGFVVRVITGIHKKMKFQVLYYSESFLTMNNIKLSNKINGKYWNMVGFERAVNCKSAKEFLFDLHFGKINHG